MWAGNPVSKDFIDNFALTQGPNHPRSLSPVDLTIGRGFFCPKGRGPNLFHPRRLREYGRQGFPKFRGGPAPSLKRLSVPSALPDCENGRDPSDSC